MRKKVSHIIQSIDRKTTYISSKKAGEMLGLAPDYISRFCREGKLSGRKVGHGWFVTEDSLKRFVKERQKEKERKAKELSEQMKAEYRANTGQAKPSTFFSVPKKELVALGLAGFITTGLFAGSYAGVPQALAKDASRVVSSATQAMAFVEDDAINVWDDARENFEDQVAGVGNFGGQTWYAWSGVAKATLSVPEKIAKVYVSAFDAQNAEMFSRPFVAVGEDFIEVGELFSSFANGVVKSPYRLANGYVGLFESVEKIDFPSEYISQPFKFAGSTLATVSRSVLSVPHKVAVGYVELFDTKNTQIFSRPFVAFGSELIKVGESSTAVARFVVESPYRLVVGYVNLFDGVENKVASLDLVPEVSFEFDFSEALSPLAVLYGGMVDTYDILETGARLALGAPQTVANNFVGGVYGLFDTTSDYVVKPVLFVGLKGADLTARALGNAGSMWQDTTLAVLSVPNWGAEKYVSFFEMPSFKKVRAPFDLPRIDIGGQMAFIGGTTQAVGNIAETSRSVFWGAYNTVASWFADDSETVIVINDQEYQDVAVVPIANVQTPTSNLQNIVAISGTPQTINQILNQPINITGVTLEEVQSLIQQYSASLRNNTVRQAEVTNDNISDSITNALTTINNTSITSSTGTFNTLSVSGDANFDSGTLTIDSVNNRVGVGTTTPSDTFSVNGPVYLANSTPAVGADRLYNTGGTLYWNGSALAVGGGASWGAITGTLSAQTDLQDALDGKFSLSAWYATTTSALAEGSNLYFTNTRADERANLVLSGTTTLPNITTLTGLTSVGTLNSGSITSGFGTIDIGSSALTAGLGTFDTLVATNASATSTFAGGLDIDSGGLVYDFSTGRVGIGTDSPEALLHLDGGSDPAKTLRIEGTLPAVDFFDSDAVQNSSNPLWRLRASDAGAFSIQKNNIDAHFSNFSSLVTILSSGNVGIGTASPDYQLEITEDFGLASGSVIYKNDQRFIHDTGTLNLFFGDRSGNLTTSGTGGNAGFGGLSLENIDTGSYNTAFGYSALNDVTTGTQNVGIGAFSGGVITTTTGNVGVGYATNLAVTGSSNTSIGRNAGRTITAASNNVFIGNWAGYDASQLTTAQNSIAIGAGAYTTKNNLAVFGSSDITETWLRGNVGIGTESPSSLLHLSKDVTSFDAAGYLKIEHPDAATGESVGTLFSLRALNPGKGYIGYIRTSNFGRGDFVFLNDAVGDDNAVGLSDEVMRITNSGNVGIGTTSPATKLDVYGGTMRLSSSNGGYYTDFINNINSSKAFEIQHHGNSILRASSDGYSAITLGTGGASLVVSRQNSNSSFTGNVGIGTASPGKKLVITDSVAASSSGQTVAELRAAYASGTLGSGANLDFGSNSNSSIFGRIGNPTEGSGLTGLSFYTYSGGLTEKLRITNAGNVGIGTTSPFTKLSVAGNGYFDGTLTASGFVATSTISAPYFSATSASATSTFAGGLNIESGGFVYDYSTNRVGIGTASPGGKLHIGGTNLVGTRDQFIIAQANDIYGRYTFKQTTTAAFAEQYLALNVINNSGTFNDVMVWNGSNVGIGTNDPDYALDVSGSINIETTTAGGDGMIRQGGTRLVHTYGTQNFFAGLGAGNLTMTASNNTAVGEASLQSLTTGNNNVGVGFESLKKVTEGQRNFGIGFRSGFDIVTGNDNVGVGYVTNFDITGSNNTSIGSNAGRSPVDASGNVFIGKDAGFHASQLLTVQNSIAIGSGTYTTANNQAIFGNDSITQTLLRGNVGIGTTSPFARLSVSGSGFFENNVTASFFTATSTTATSTFAGGVSIGNGVFEFEPSSGVASLQNVELGALLFDTDAGIISWVDLPVSSSPVAGTVQSYSAQIDGNALLTVYSEADGSGGIQNRRIGLGTSTPVSTLSMTQTGETQTDGFWLEATDGDYRSIYMNTSQVLSFQGGAGNTATLNAAGEWTNASDASYKEEIVALDYGLAELRELQPRRYHIIGTSASSTNLGFIAQELELIIPEVVTGPEGSKGVSYGNLVTVAIKGIQDLADAMEQLGVEFANGVARFTSLVAQRVTTQELCLGQTCITEAELQALLASSGQAGANLSADDADDFDGDAGTTTDDGTDDLDLEGGTTTDDGIDIGDTGTSTDDGIDEPEVDVEPEPESTPEPGEEVVEDPVEEEETN